MNLSLQDLQTEAATTGFLPEALDKVIRLIGLLDAFPSHPFLKDRVALEGGTALNFFVFDLPRLSVDIDLNYIGSAYRDVMLVEREKVEQAIRVICGREGFTLRCAYRKNTPAVNGGWVIRMRLAAIPITKSMWSSPCGFHCGRYSYGIPIRWGRSRRAIYRSSIFTNLRRAICVRSFPGRRVVISSTRMHCSVAAILNAKSCGWVLSCMARAVVRIGEPCHLTIYAAIGESFNSNATRLPGCRAGIVERKRHPQRPA